jgi:ADP-ribose pyrophosphatase YjhB (NUDIX family)
MVWVLHGTDPEFCPRCGGALDVRETDEGPRPQCEDCDVILYHNAGVMARTAVVETDRVLLIERGAAGDVGAWATAGGYVEAGEGPREAAARELEEETGLAVAPDDLTLVADGVLDFGDGETDVAFNYAVHRSKTAGSVDAGSDAADARWWTREELRADLPEEKNNLRAIGLDALLDVLDDVS